MAMICLGSASVFIGLLGLLLFRGYHHDHNISHEIDEQKKNDFVRSVHTTLRNLDRTSEYSVKPLLERKSMPTMSLPSTVPELVITGSTTSISMSKNNNNNSTVSSKLVTKPQELILPSLNETYQSAFTVSEPRDSLKRERNSDGLDQQLRVPESMSMQFTRMRSRSGDSVMSSTFALNQDPAHCDDEFQESRVYATLHALSLHSLVCLRRHSLLDFDPLAYRTMRTCLSCFLFLQAVLLEALIVLFSGLLNQFIPHKDKNGDPMNSWLQYIDPSLTLVMVVIIAIKAIPVVWSLGHILVEAVPSGIDTRHLIKTIVKTIPQIRAVHSVHVWRYERSTAFSLLVHPTSLLTRATARDIFATLHVVCNEDLPLSACAELFGRQLQQIFETHCIRHFTLQFEYAEPGSNINRCVYGTRRRHRGHQSTSENDANAALQSQIDLPVNSLTAEWTDQPRRSV